jgi:hypothetical protein
MAIITTSKALGWYGVHGPSGCSPLSLPDHFGKYTSSGSFITGASGLSEAQASLLQVWTMLDMGAPWPWKLEWERKYRYQAQRDVILKLDQLECGQMYWFDWKGSSEFNVPGFCPTALGVDMGRISV